MTARPPPWKRRCSSKRRGRCCGTSHPAMLALQPVAGQDTASPSLRHDQQHDWWVLQVEGTASVDGKPLKLTVALVVAGYVQE